ncbi:MAG: hypothetical protein H6875_01760 [Hyphomicrobiaceae bacterium]|nr:hypothetical protein [Hyphomicrobiaceae bacterium]
MLNRWQFAPIATMAFLVMAVCAPPSARLALADATQGNAASDCFSEHSARRIAGCTSLLEGGKSLSVPEKSLAYAMRALAYSLQQDYVRALEDYDKAIGLRPNFDVALNNRAWALYKMQRYEEGMKDVQRSLKITPWSAHAFDTRAHLHQVAGRQREALSDYLLAMRFGGEKLVKLYQCGLEAHGLFNGPIDGLESEDLRQALVSCVRDQSCDPLPPEEECRRPMS